MVGDVKVMPSPDKRTVNGTFLASVKSVAPSIVLTKSSNCLGVTCFILLRDCFVERVSVA